MVNGRNKGAAFEREVAKMLFLDLGVKFKRDIEQYRAADHGDLICDDPSFPFTLELKRYAKGYTYQKAWWDQVVAAASAQGKEPALIYKFDHRPIFVVMRLAFITQDETYEDERAILTWSGFTQIARESWNDTHGLD
jgi:Holliday junction resolvase